ncbi:HNH endonuclease [Enterococcus lactis]|uniref:HNH endonuclease n=1 Tax=Enterococcus lactis TaxID=357441 RepID=UPI001BCA8CE3|nr:hypothetical protein [Enterococcus lactis]
MEINKSLFKTYRRRKVTRQSGYHVSGIHTGSECIIQESDRFYAGEDITVFRFRITNIDLVELFELNTGYIAFAGYIKPEYPSKAFLQLEYVDQDNISHSATKKSAVSLKGNVWNDIGIHDIKSLDDALQNKISEAVITLTIQTTPGSYIDFTSVDFAPITYSDYLSNDFYTPFKQKTNIHIPQIYYLSTEEKIDNFLFGTKGISENSEVGDPIVLKGCNRCARYLPINITNEETTLAFSNHCKSKAPCKHTSFSLYRIDNIEDISNKSIDYLKDFIVDDKYIRSYYGHQLECTACKKYYVNYALNPLRNPQQFKEDGLRRRALEVLVTTLLNKKSIHHEFEYRTKKEFTEFIWNRFNKRCFYCQKKISLKEMHLDHTMPLAYLYNLDEHATCLCAEHNSRKSDKFPKDFYSEEQLIELSKITGLNLSILKSDSPNMEVVNLLIDNIEWFFDEFLMLDDYQKIRSDRLTADKIYASLEKILKPHRIDLLGEYYKKTNGRSPQSITLEGY